MILVMIHINSYNSFHVKFPHVLPVEAPVVHGECCRFTGHQSPLFQPRDDLAKSVREDLGWAFFGVGGPIGPYYYDY